jgi:predicted alpha/beta superfamily hydrolase
MPPLRLSAPFFILALGACSSSSSGTVAHDGGIVAPTPDGASGTDAAHPVADAATHDDAAASDEAGSHHDGAASDGGTSSHPEAGSSTGPEAGSSDATAADGASTVPAGTALIRIHYPAMSHTVTIRGGAAGLSWTAGTPTTASGDTYSVTLTGITTPVEWKPLLDGTIWALGPNYHIASGETVDIAPHFMTTTGTVETLIADFHSTILDNDRVIYAYLPASYLENTDATYPVVYMHDGQNLWAALPAIAFSGTWNVDTAFDDASNEGTCSVGTVVGWGAQPLGAAPVTCNGDADCTSGACRTFPEAIVIGVANTANRIYEYTPTTDPTTAGGGGADLYLQMLVQELKPVIDGMLRTRPGVDSTAMAGSSLGGLVTAYAGLKYPGVYGRIAEISPSTWWNTDVIVGDVQTGTLAAPMRPLVVYVDSGAGTADDEADTDMLASAYLALGYVDGTNFRQVTQAGAQHSETYWAERFPGAMQLLLGVR